MRTCGQEIPQRTSQEDVYKIYHKKHHKGEDTYNIYNKKHREGEDMYKIYHKNTLKET